MVKNTKKSDVLVVKQVRSGAGKVKSQVSTLIGLGLNKLNKTVTLNDTPAIRGMIDKVKHLVQIIES